MNQFKSVSFFWAGVILFVFYGCCSAALVYADELGSLSGGTKSLLAEAERFSDGDPLFSKWLENQYLIQKRIAANVESDRKIGTEEALFRSQSELNDLRYLQKKIAEEINYLDRLKPNDKVINVIDCGAKADGKTDDSSAISEALARAGQEKAGIVFFPKGDYYIKKGVGENPTEQSPHINLKGYENLELKGEPGTRFIFGKPVCGGVNLDNCNNVRLTGVEITYRPLPYTIGRVMKVVPQGYVVKIEKGFPRPDEPYFSAHDFKGLTRFYSSGLLDGSVRPEASNVFSHLAAPQVTHISGDEYQFTYNHGLPGHLVGMHVAFQARRYGNHGIQVVRSRRCRITGVKLYASPAMSFLSLSSEITFINNCTAGPDPELKTFASSNADGIFVRDALLGGLISGNTIKYVGDDFFNTHSSTHPAQKIEENVFYIPGHFWKGMLQKGQRLGWIRSSRGEMHVSGEAFITGLEEIMLNKQVAYKVTCDRKLPELVTLDNMPKEPRTIPDFLTIMENQFHGGVVTGNDFSHGLSRILLGGRNYLFTKNKIQDSIQHFCLFYIGPRTLGGTHGGEGCQARNILIADNVINSRAKTVFMFGDGLNPYLQTVDKQATTHVEISNNDVTLNGRVCTMPLLHARCVSELTVKDNRIVNNCNTVAAVFEAKDCSGLKVTGNKIAGNFSGLFWDDGDVSGLTAGENILDLKPTRPRVFMGWDFTKAKIRKEWLGLNTHCVKIMDSPRALKMMITGSDPYIVFPEMKSAIDGTKYGCVIVKMKATAACAGKTNEVFWKTADRGFCAEQHAGFPAKLTERELSEFYYYNFSVNWQASQKVTGLRLDLFDGVPGGTVVEIESITITDVPYFSSRTTGQVNG